MELVSSANAGDASIVCCNSDRILTRKGPVPPGSCPAAWPKPHAFKAAAKLNSVSLVSKLTFAVGVGAGAAGTCAGDFAGEPAGVLGEGFTFWAMHGIAAKVRHNTTAMLRFHKIRRQNSLRQRTRKIPPAGAGPATPDSA